MTKRWVYDPDSGGVKVPEKIRPKVKQRILDYAEANFAGKYTKIDVRFRGVFCYIDAYQEPNVAPGWPPPDFPETREEFIERLRNTPVHLCRMRYFGNIESWSFAFYTYSHNKYELCYLENGTFFGTPEECFFSAAVVYLEG